MRHLISPLDFTVEELDRLLTIASDIEKIRKSTVMPVKARSWRRFFMSQVQEHALVLKRQCLIWAEVFSDFRKRHPVRHQKERVYLTQYR